MAEPETEAEPGERLLSLVPTSLRSRSQAPAATQHDVSIWQAPGAGEPVGAHQLARVSILIDSSSTYVSLSAGWGRRRLKERPKEEWLGADLKWVRSFNNK